MQQLAEGNLRASDEEQEHFLLVISGKINPLYFVEHTYLKYLSLIKKEKTGRSVKKSTLSEILNENLAINDNREQAENFIYSVQ